MDAENHCIVINLLSGCREPLYNVYVVRNLLSMAAENLCIVRNILCATVNLCKDRNIICSCKEPLCSVFFVSAWKVAANNWNICAAEKNHWTKDVFYLFINPIITCRRRVPRPLPPPWWSSPSPPSCEAHSSPGGAVNTIIL